MRGPRSVTLQPIGAFSRSLKFAIDFLARVTTGFWPVIACRSAVAKSRTLAFSFPSPTPMLITIFSSRGTWKGLLYPRSFMSAGTTTLRNRSRSRGGTCPDTAARLAGAAGSAWPACFPPPLGRAAACGPLPPAGAFCCCGFAGFFSSAIALSLVDGLAGLARHADLSAVRELAHADAGRPVAGRVHEHDVGEVDGVL